MDWDDPRDKLEFMAPYKGDADVHLEAYVTKCWLEYCNDKDRSLYPSPHVTLVQSSGFGKSRSLYELSRRSLSSSHMKVLYLCARMNVHSSGYPLRTPSLHCYWFPDSNVSALVDRLCGMFDYAMEHWDQVGDEWMRVFTERADDRVVARRLAAFTRGSVDLTGKPHDTEATHRVVVFAIDVARDLHSNNNRTSARICLETALATACARIQARYGAYAGILALLVDNDPIILRPSDRFAPFVLTQNVDVMLDEAMHAAQASGTTRTQFYQELVCDTSDESIKANLVRLGRPLWASCGVSFSDIVRLAARKLLVGLPPPQLTSGNMYGFPAMLARLGTLELSHSPDVDHFVGNALATLVAAGSGQASEKIRGTYLSEPVVAFGATHTWYCDEHWALEQILLPRLRKLEEVKLLDGGARGRLVASIVLLLAMDTVGVVETGYSSERKYTGAFYSAATLLAVLSGSTSEMEDEDGQALKDDEAANGLERLRGQWAQWKVGFGQFVPLSQMPTEDVLWMLLSRRAAGVLSSTPQGVSLVIPIFQHQGTASGDSDPVRRVSSIRVYAANFAGGDPVFPANVVAPIDDPHAICVYMNLRGPKPPRRFFLQTPSAVALCLEGLMEQKATARKKSLEPIAFLPSRVVDELKELAQPEFENIPVMQIMMDATAAKGNVARPLIDAMFGGKWQQTAVEYAAGDENEVADSAESGGKRSREGDDDADTKLPRLE